MTTKYQATIKHYSTASNPNTMPLPQGNTWQNHEATHGHPTFDTSQTLIPCLSHEASSHHNTETQTQTIQTHDQFHNSPEYNISSFPDASPSAAYLSRHPQGFPSCAGSRPMY